MSRAYSADLAYIHNEGFAASIPQAKAHLLELIKPRTKLAGSRERRKPLVVDLGCGSGIWARELLRAGYDVLGIDISEPMIRLARKNAPGGHFVKGSIRNFQLPDCDAVSALGEVITYCFDPNLTRGELRRLFARVHAALSPGGLFILDFAGPGRAGPAGVREGFSLGSDWAVLFRVKEDRRRRELRRTITSFCRVGELYRRTQEVHKQRLYTPLEVGRQLRQAGFEVKRLEGYGRSGFPGGVTGYAARKM